MGGGGREAKNKRHWAGAQPLQRWWKWTGGASGCSHNKRGAHKEAAAGYAAYVGGFSRKVLSEVGKNIQRDGGNIV